MGCALAVPRHACGDARGRALSRHGVCRPPRGSAVCFTDLRARRNGGCHSWEGSVRPACLYSLRDVGNRVPTPLHWDAHLWLCEGLALQRVEAFCYFAGVFMILRAACNSVGARFPTSFESSQNSLEVSLGALETLTSLLWALWPFACASGHSCRRSNCHPSRGRQMACRRRKSPPAPGRGEFC